MYLDDHLLRVAKLMTKVVELEAVAAFDYIARPGKPRTPRLHFRIRRRRLADFEVVNNTAEVV